MFKKILAPVRGTHEDAAALDVGFLLARRFGARVEAFYAAPSSPTSVTVDTVESKRSDEVARLEGTELYLAALALFSERLERATSIVPQSSGLSACFSALPGPEADLVATNGRVSDLIITAHPAADEPSWPNLSLESAIRETGCPVLLIPQAVSRIGARVAIAWNGTVEVARAVRFALPLLRESEQTKVVYRSARVSRAVALRSRPGTPAGNQGRAVACRRPARPPWRLRTRYWPSAE